MSQEQQPTANRDWSWGSFKQIGRQLGLMLLIGLSWALVLGVILAPEPTSTVASVSPSDVLTWDEHIFPIIQQHCLLCHGASGGISLASYESTLEGGVHGPGLVPGDAQNSLLYLTLLGPVDDIPAMPLGQPLLPDETVAIVEAWINQLPSQ